MLNNLTRREICSFIFLFYTNIHMFLLLIYENFYSNMLFNNISFYSLIDIVWIYFDNNLKINKQELIIHHVATLVLITSNVNLSIKIQILIIELSSLLLFILKISKGIFKKISYFLFILCWFCTRVFWLYIFFIKYKLLGLGGEFFRNKLEIFSLIIIYLLGIKWTLDFMKISRYKSYTSVLLSIPIFLNSNNLTFLQFISILNITIISFVHHLVKHKITASLDDFFITFCSLIYLNYNIQITILLSFVSFLSKYLTNNSYNNYCIYIYTLHYYSKKYFIIKLVSLFTIYGLYKLKIYKKSFLWHFSNGINLYFLSRYLQ